MSLKCEPASEQAYAAYQATLSGKPAMAAAPAVLPVLGAVKILADYDATEGTCLTLKKDEVAEQVCLSLFITLKPRVE